MRVYIAAPYPTRNDAITLMHAIEKLGHSVTSRWLTQIDDDGPDAAMMDIMDIERCDVLLLWNPIAWHNAGTGGRHFEMGYAAAIGKRLVVLGARSSNFHHLPGVRVITQVEDL
jgi:nucleoside 2-deoxyribosyltransferase